MVDVYLGIGSNVGDRRRNIEKSIEFLRKICVIEKTSKIYETLPWGYKKQPKFLNCCLKIKTNLPPSKILKELKLIEKKLKRKKTVKYGPRTIDLDILFYGNQVIKQKNLVIPHKYLHKRKFVLIGLKEICPNFKHPVLGKTISQLYKKMAQ